ncbi:MAG: hypothetical protein HYZ47_01305 [Simkania negevensis]|nr:hypothetical protein [Simkania negevensis]
MNIFRNTSGQINLPRWHDEKYAALLDCAGKEISLKKRLFYYRQAEEILCEQVPILPLLRRQLYSIKKSRLEIINHCHLKQWDFKWASISKLKEV